MKKYNRFIFDAGRVIGGDGRNGQGRIIAGERPCLEVEFDDAQGVTTRFPIAASFEYGVWRIVFAS
jgi:hypothetical protein